MESVEWIWKKESPEEDAIAGDIAKLFKAEGTLQPGVLQLNAPPESSLLFAREAIQNSWDAASALRRDFKLQGREDDLNQFLLEIRFQSANGSEKKSIAEVLGLFDLAKRIKEFETEAKVTNDPQRRARSPRSVLGLQDEDALSNLEDPDVPLNLLYFEENEAIGMFGNWENSESRMMLALNRVGYTKKDDGSGGSYGYGKAGLIQASKIRMVFAYTCFQEQPDEPGVTRRLMGATYWGPHKVGGVPYTGWVRFGEPSGTSAKPYINEHADEIAAQLGLTARSAEVVKQLGTSFLLVDPTIQPEDLRVAIERNWWPSIAEQEGLRVRITTSDGETIVPRVPKDDPDLSPFVEAFEWAQRPRENSSETAKGFDLGSYNPTGTDRNFQELGRLGLVADPEGWSFPQDQYIESSDSDGDGIKQQSLIALIRSPRMVVRYLPIDTGPPYVRGACVISDPEVDELMRQTEPKAHDSWDYNIDPQQVDDPEAPKVARRIDKKIRELVGGFRSGFKIPTPPPGPISLPELDKLMRLMKGKKPPPPPPGEQKISVTYPVAPHVVADTEGDTVHFAATVALKYLPKADETKGKVRIRLALLFVEDSKLGRPCKISVKAPNGFKEIISDDFKKTFEGVLDSTKRQKFDVASSPYSPDWSTQLVIEDIEQ